jgi:methionine synthase I (cobalamin-dependent)
MGVLPVSTKYMKTRPLHPLEKILEQRIAIIDGAMGTTIRTYGMKKRTSGVSDSRIRRRIY